MPRSYSSAPPDDNTGLSDVEPFELDGETFTPAGEFGILDLSEFAGWADLDADSPQGLAAIRRFLLMVLGEGEYQRFYRHTKRHRTDSDTLLAIVTDIVDQVFGRPTEAPSSLPVSPSATGRGSTGAGSHRVVSLQARTVRIEPDLPGIGEIGDVAQG